MSLLLVNPVSAWWNETYTKRTNFTIINGATNLTNYQLMINVTYDSDMMANFSDLRFQWLNTTSGLEQSADYWIENKTDSSLAYVWVEIPSVRASLNETLLMYYGYSDVVSNSNGTNTFISFSDFEGSKDGWINASTVGYSELTTATSFTGNSCVNVSRTGTDDPAEDIYLGVTFPSTYVVDFGIRSGGLQEYEAGVHYSGSTGYTNKIILYLNTANDFKYKLGAAGSVDTGQNFVVGTWYRGRMERINSTHWKLSYYQANRTLIWNSTALAYAPTTPDRLLFVADGGTGMAVKHQMDTVIVRNYALIIPSYSLLTEENVTISPPINNCSICNETCSPCGGGCNATNMSYMFQYVINFDNVVGNITGWNTSCVIDMNYMFSGAEDFNQDIGSWDTSKVTDMGAMFSGGGPSGMAFNKNISGWNTGSVTDMSGMFAGSTAFNQEIGSWNVSSVTDMNNMFSGATSFNQPIDNWDVSAVTDMYNMFSGATSFNQSLSSWNTGSVTNMNSMFYGASAFNNNISGWNTGKVTNMFAMFEYIPFNQPIGNWNISSVTNIHSMFSSTPFNQDISGWNTGSVTDMGSVFWLNTAFNQNISGWNTGYVTDMSYMFSGATSFNQNVGSWNVSSVTDMTSMFQDIALSTLNYDSLLTGWSSRLVQPNVVFGGGNSMYSNCSGGTVGGVVGRNILTNDTNSWIITDGGSNITGCLAVDTCSCPASPANWFISLLDHCNITSSCNIAGYNLTFTNGTTSDYCNITNAINFSNINMNSTGIVWVWGLNAVLKRMAS